MKRQSERRIFRVSRYPHIAMSTPRGIFETFPNQPLAAGAPLTSPFAIAHDSPAPSPFVAAPPAQARRESPFSVVGENEPHDDSKTIRLPERRKSSETPFQISEPQGFGFEAAPQARKANPYEPVSQPQQAAPASPFTMVQTPAPQPAPASPFGGWPQAEVAPAPAPFVAPPQAHALTPQPVPAASEYAHSDSFQIKQLELRAIFGVDREMTKEEIIQRSRSLPGVRHIALVGESDIAAVDALKQVVTNLGFGGGAIKLYSGSVPIEFIREGRTLLAVQTDGGFAPGVRETLMIVARELSR
jgi:hypothetical protein